MAQIDLTGLTPVADTRGETPDETTAIQALARRAAEYLLSHSWCLGIQQQFTALAFPRIFGLFLFQIAPSSRDVDEWLWVVIGDIPPAYLVTDEAPDALSAIELYDDLMQEWVDAVLAGEPTDDLIPVNVPPTREYAEMLRSRLELIREMIIPWLRNE
jgi:hypothetical protein